MGISQGPHHDHKSGGKGQFPFSDQQADLGSVGQESFVGGVFSLVSPQGLVAQGLHSQGISEGRGKVGRASCRERVCNDV